MNLKLLQFIGIDSDFTDYDLFVENTGPDGGNVIGIHPGCDNNGAIKRWPITRYVEFAERVEKNGGQVVFFIGPAEDKLAPLIRTSESISVIKPKSLKDLISLTSRCKIFVSNDNGPAHLAAALKVPTIVIYGPTKKTEFVLPTNYIGIEPVGYDCKRCVQKKECHNEGACLNSISVDEVMEHYRNLSNSLIA
jgi:ADP-heptose:LPS heptosyltransferase